MGRSKRPGDPLLPRYQNALRDAPGVLHKVVYHGQSIVKGKRVTGFANSEEAAVHLDVAGARPHRGKIVVRHTDVARGRRAARSAAAAPIRLAKPGKHRRAPPASIVVAAD